MAAASPLLAWRDPVYIIAGFAGIVAMSLLLVQPLLARGRLPGLNIRQSRTLHRMTGAALVAGVVIHVVGLWVTSPPDVVDALLFRSPTPFSAWGVIAMWAVFAAAVLAVFRRRLRPRLWRLAHSGIAVVIVTGTVIHALQIEGTMETASKVALCALVIAATISVFVARTRAGAS
nr:ferric reductase-like transmembrane domain-containing protein [Roseobacter ponti]